MLGRLRPKISQLTLQEEQDYKAGYCGLCQSLRRESGGFSTLTLSYELTFLAHLEVAHRHQMLQQSSMSCTAVPWKKVPSLTIPAKIGALGLVVSGLKLEDDRRDERSLKARLGLYFLQPKIARALKTLKSEGFPIPSFEHYSREQFQVEQSLSRNNTLHRRERLRLAASPSGQFVESVFDWLVKGWTLQSEDGPKWRTLGRLLGEAVYLVDALEDRVQDTQKDNFNPLSGLTRSEWDSVQKDFESRAQTLLELWSELPPRSSAWPGLTSSLEQLSQRLTGPVSNASVPDARLQGLRKRQTKAAFCLTAQRRDAYLCVDCIGSALSALCWFAGSSRREREMEAVHGDLLQTSGQPDQPGGAPELERIPLFVPGHYACPSCGNEPMDSQVIGAAGLFHCSKCSGVWLNGAHLPELRKHQETRTFITFPQAGIAPVHRPGTRVCPSDGATLELSREQGVTVEECPTCQGWYLDAGELGSLL